MASADFRDLPAVAAVKALPQMAVLFSRHGEAFVTDQVRAEIEARREAIRHGAGDGPPSAQDIADAVAVRLAREAEPPLVPVINATGVVIHTNLGRAPLAPEALAAADAAAREAAALEFDLDAGRRGHRDRLVSGLLCELTGAEAATVVNNNAAAVLIVLDTLARGGEVVISRGELVEIGGGFRIPDVLARSGARLVEVGTTNKTRIGDYERALTPDTRLLMKVHSSNFRMVGFTESATREEIVALARRRRVRAVEDLGSGALVDLRPVGVADEPMVQDSVRAGLDAITFSGDKLLGGPQAGIILGAADLIDAIRTNPLMRALRCDKVTLAALAATLRLYRNPERATTRIPVLAALHRSLDDVRAQAEHVAAALADVPGLAVRTAPCDATTGGGSGPGMTLPSAAVVLTADAASPDELAARLRAERPAIVGRVADDALWLDQRTVPPGSADALAAGVRAALAR